MTIPNFAQKAGENDSNATRRFPMEPQRILGARSNLTIRPAPRTRFVINARDNSEGTWGRAPKDGEVRGFRKEVGL